MADNKKEQERAELHRTIWGIANDLRGSVDGWDFKQYVLGMLFYRYISENLAAYINDGERAAGDASFNYAALADNDYDKFDVALGDTLTDPLHWDDEPFEAIVSNPPYSIKWAGAENPLLINDPRFSPAGVLAPKSKADLAFIMHSLSWLATSGTAAIVCFPGILYRGGAEQKIRKYLVDNNYIDCVIQLPDNLFFGTSIATCIMVLKKSKSENSTLFIDASREFVKVTNSNKLTRENIEKIVTAYTKHETVQYFTRLVPNGEIAAHDYNISVSTYIEQEDKREVVDINALNAEIERIVAREDVLRREIAAIIAEIEGENANG